VKARHNLPLRPLERGTRRDVYVKTKRATYLTKSEELLKCVAMTSKLMPEATLLNHGG
jgi:hypothetical protein